MGLDPIRCAVGPRADAGTARELLLERFPALADAAATALDERFARGEIVRPDGSPWAAGDVLRPGDVLWFHREPRPEQVPDVALPVLAHDEHLLVIDKPHDMATIPRGVHVLSSALVRLRRRTGITDLVPLHRLDRLTAGVLAFGVRREERADYQTLFARGAVRKTYRAVVADRLCDLEVGEDLLLRDRLDKPHGSLQALVLDGEPNAETALRVLAVAGEGHGRRALLELRPRTGRTHQLRVQLASRGWPILGDDLYPIVRRDPPALPLQLLAARLAFTDPVTGQERDLVSGRQLALESEEPDGPGALTTLVP